ncbi:MAG: response regulator [Candidatus Heimdallarchaeota archaeon]
MTNKKDVTVLLVEDNPGDARLIQNMLSKASIATFNLLSAERLSAGFDHLSSGDIDVILLDLTLPDSHGLETFVKMHKQAQNVPIIVLTGLDDEDVAIKAAREGAQDYLVKGTITGPMLARSIRYAIERLEIQQELKKSLLVQERLRFQKLESLGVLAGGIAHDFNNILLTIFSNIALAKMDIDPKSPAFEAIEESEKAYSRIKAQTRQLLTFAKGGVPIKEVASINRLLRKTAKFALSGSNLKLIFSISDDLWPVYVDSNQIGQIMHNLILNSQHAQPNGGIIEIKGENIVLGSDERIPGGQRNSKWIKIALKDTGSGIPEKHLEKIFDPYFTTKHEGRGLGLATVYSILKNHGGHIKVKSAEGVGTTITFYLPASDKVPVKNEISEPTTPFTGERRILLMDDDEILLSSISRLLLRQGFKVKCARDGLEAIEMYKQALQSSQPYDAVIMDLVVPGGMGGKESMQKLIEIDPDIKAIVSSGYSDDPVMADYEKYGFCGVLPKPYKIRELATLIQEVTGGPEN